MNITIELALKQKKYSKYLAKKKPTPFQSRISIILLLERVLCDVVIAKIYPLRHFEAHSKAKTTFIHTSIRD